MFSSRCFGLRRLFTSKASQFIAVGRICVVIVTISLVYYHYQVANTPLLYDTDTSCQLVEPGLYFKATSSNIDVGQTELEQYYRYTQIKKNHTHFASYAEYAYETTIIENRSTTDGIFLRIEERFRGKFTHGGSSFTITAHHVAKEQCPYRDMFNGTYLVWCPPMTVRERREIVLTLEYVNFAAFDSARPASFRVVRYHAGLRLDNSNMNPKAKDDAPVPLRSLAVAAALKTYARKQDVVQWYKDTDIWKVKLANGEHFLSLSTKRMCDCIKKMRRLIMMGSSHMRYKFAYIAQVCYDRTGVGFTGQTKPVKNVHFVEFFLAENYTTSFRRHLRDIQLGDDDVVLVQTGAHDLARKGLSYFMDSMVKYVDTLATVRNQTKVRRHNFVVLTPPPFPMYATATRKTGDRNSFCIAASARRLKQLLAKHDFEVFDEFSILRPVAERDTAITAHYISPLYNGKTFGVYGDVGFTAARLMMSQICEANKRWLSL